jgi:hypothetical protein
MRVRGVVDAMWEKARKAIATGPGSETFCGERSMGESRLKSDRKRRQRIWALRPYYLRGLEACRYRIRVAAPSDPPLQGSTTGYVRLKVTPGNNSNSQGKPLLLVGFMHAN